MHTLTPHHVAAHTAPSALQHHPLRPPPACRPVRAADALLFDDYVEQLSPAAQRCRFHGVVRGCTPGLRALLAGADGHRHVALVATLAADGGERLIGEARYVADASGDAAEFAISVADAWRGTGVAGRLMQRLLDEAAAQGIGWLYGEVLESNGRMLAFMRRMGFALNEAGLPCGEAPVPGRGVVRVERCVAAAPRLSACSGAGGPAIGWLQRWMRDHLPRSAGGNPVC